MALKAWVTTKDSLGFAWQMREEVLGGSIFYGVLFTVFLIGLNSMGYSYADLLLQSAQMYTGGGAELSSELKTLMILMQVFTVLVALFFSYRIQTILLRRADAPAAKPVVSFAKYAPKFIGVRLIPHTLLLLTSMFSFQGVWDIALACGVGAVLTQVLMIRFDLAVAATAAGDDEDGLMQGFALGAGNGFKMFFGMLAALIIVQLVFIPVNIGVGLFANPAALGGNEYFLYLNWVLEGVKAGVSIYVAAILNAAYFCALKPEYGFVVDDTFYTIGQEEHDEIPEPAE